MAKRTFAYTYLLFQITFFVIANVSGSYDVSVDNSGIVNEAIATAPKHAPFEEEQTDSADMNTSCAADSNADQSCSVPSLEARQVSESANGHQVDALDENDLTDDENSDDEDADDEDFDDHDNEDEFAEDRQQMWKEDEEYLDEEFSDEEEEEFDDFNENVDEEFDNSNDNVDEEFDDVDEVGSDMGVPQELFNYNIIRQRIEEARQYLHDFFQSEDEQFIEHYDAMHKVCFNKDKMCAFWAVEGECESNPNFMKENCSPVCYSCDFAWKQHVMYPDEVSGSVSVADGVGADLGVPQHIDGTNSSRLLDEAREYIQNVVMKEDKYDIVRSLCVNKHEECANWAAFGECQNNPNYMEINCAPICQTCEQMHITTRCPLDPTIGDALYPGDLNRMFERILGDPAMAQYEPKVLSRPDYDSGDGPETANSPNRMWLLMLDNVTTAAEAERMMELAALEGYNRSADVGDLLEDGSYSDNVNSGRTSENAWCQDACINDTVTMRIMDRMEHITGIPGQRAEHLQLLRYQVGQKYDRHNDYIPYQVDRPPGVRILTFFLYLNDVEEGGETNFPVLGISVKPKMGRAILWPSVLDHDPNKNDLRSDHQALPVIKGIKHGANAWFHQRDVKGRNERCL